MMMPPAAMVTAIPTIVVAATAVMAPPMSMSMPMAVTAFDLNNYLVGSAQRIGRCCGHSRCRQSRCKCKDTAGKSDHQKPIHFCCLLLFEILLTISFAFSMLTERRIHSRFRTVAADL